MTNCPACGHDVRTPFFLDLSKWSDLNCPQCKARLEMKPPRSVVLGPLMAPLFVLARRGRVFEVIAFTFAFVTILLLLVESSRPKLRLRRKPLPKAEIRLNIDGRPN
jgi:DNA-directed RNA polymerase subunit RPC12/RpoP